ncbi:hypothetical protein EZS27_032796, partial [termite gut metagenome]
MVGFSSNSIKVNETVTITVTPSQELISPSYVYEVSDLEKASVSKDGVLTAKAVGTVKVTVSTKVKSKKIEGKSGDLTIQSADITVSSLSLIEPDSVVGIGSTVLLAVVYTPANSTLKSVLFVSSDPSILSVDSLGNITGVAVGSATITVTSTSNPSVSYTSNLIYVGINYVARILDYSSTLDIGETSGIIVSYSPENTTYKDVTYVSSDPFILTVDSLGIMTGIAVGSAKVIINNSYYKETWTTEYIEVKNPLIGISLQSPNSLAVGERGDIIVTLNPGDTSYPNVSYTSSDPSILAVDSNGVIYGVSEGTTVITVRSISNPSIFNVTTLIYVYNPLVSLSVLSPTYLKIDESLSLSIGYTPENIFNQGVSFLSSDNTVLTVNSSGVITGIKEGVARVTVTSLTNSQIFKVSEDITVYRAFDSLSVTSPDKIGIGSSLTLTVKFNPSNATYKNVSFVSSNSLVLSVNSSGLISGLTEGVAFIYIIPEFEPDNFIVSSNIGVYDQEYVDALEFVEDYYKYNLL